ncbi:permease prefix domain 1-containing protein [Virgibacillus byunsanensis]|uniref:Permease prefix domain 1-containing protein n=1 Tax=Virgibacillus byunsanensis TaxID=570945 RepID=A0ABW3LPZ1_9BACI
MEEKFEVYINNMTNKLDCSEAEKAEVTEEIQDHLLLLKEEFIRNGYSEEQAVDLSITAFGEETRIGSELQKAMFPCRNLVKWIGTSLSLLLALFLLSEGITLWNIGSTVDGAGIGIHFLGFEINDHVLVQRIPSYAAGFMVASLLTALVPLVLFRKKLVKFKILS